MWTRVGFLLVVDLRRWRPNNSLQSFDYLLSIPFLTTLEANVSVAYNGYVYMVTSSVNLNIGSSLKNYRLSIHIIGRGGLGGVSNHIHRLQPDLRNYRSRIHCTNGVGVRQAE